MLFQRAKNWALSLLSAFLISSCNHAFAQIGPGGYTPRSVYDVGDGANVNGHPYEIEVTAGTLSYPTSGIALISTGAGGGSGNVGIGTIGLPSVYTSTTTLGPAANLQDLAYCQSNGTNCPASAGSNYWLLNTGAGNVGVGTTNNNVGIGTTKGNGGLIVMAGNVGIGTFNPNSSLDVEGGNVSIGTTVSTNVLNLKGGSSISSTGIISLNSTTAQITNLNTGATSQLAFVGGGGSSSKLLLASGNASSTSNDLIEFLLDGQSQVSMILQDNSGQVNVGIGTTLFNAGLSVMNGNVGIGTWNPSNLFQVNGNVGIGTEKDTYSLTIGSGTTLTGTKGNSGIIQQNNGTLTSGNLTKADSNQNIVDAGIAASAVSTQTFGTLTNPDWCTTNGTSISCTSAVPVTAFSGDNYLLNNSSSTGAVTATLATHTQNTVVGAATSTSLADLSLPSCSTASSALTYTTNTGFGCNSITGGGANYWLNDNNGGAGNVGISTVVGGGNSVGIGTTMTTSSALVVMGGNVGIGTWNPTSLLQVNGNVGVGTFTATYSSAIAVGTGTSLALTGNIGVGGASVSTNALQVTGNVGVSQNVGISTTTAPSNLYVAGTSQITSTAIFNGNVGIGTYSGLAGLQISGNVGIGTTVAGAQAGSNNLMTWGNIGVGTSFLGGTGEGALTVMNGNVGIGTWVPIGLAQIGPGPGGDQTVVSGNNWFGGNVGLGTTLSTNVLDVNGGEGIGATYAGYQSAPSNGLIVQGNVGLGTIVPETNAYLTGTGFITANLVVGSNIGIGTSVASAPGTTPEPLYNQGKTSLIGNVGIGTNIPSSYPLQVVGAIATTTDVHLNGNLFGGITGNLGIGTATTGAGSTCDTACNNLNERCAGGLNLAIVGFEPCSVSIVGDCFCAKSG